MPHITIRVTEAEKADYRELANGDKTLTKIIKTYLNRLVGRSRRQQ